MTTKADIHFANPQVAALYKKLLFQWEGCTKCPLHTTRTQLVHFRGYLPCDVLFIGEAPGDSEDTAGIPFAPNAPAGERFDQMLEAAYHSVGTETGHLVHPSKPVVGATSIPYGIINIVACRPKTPKTEFSSGELREPTPEEALACQPRLLELIRIAAPKLIVTLGRVAEKHLPYGHLGEGYTTDKGKTFVAPAGHIKWLPLIHPSAILRAPDTRQPTMEKRFVLHLAEALKELV